MSRVRTCVVVAEERPRTALTQSFSKLFKDLGLHPRAVSTSFGCRVNLAICLQVGGRLPGSGRVCPEVLDFRNGELDAWKFRVELDLLVSADLRFLVFRPAKVCEGCKCAVVG